MNGDTMPRMRLHPVLVACAWLMALSPAWAQSDKPTAADEAFFTEASECAAAFEARVVERMTQPKSPARDQAVLNDTELGFVYVGVAYQRGLRNPKAADMLKAAEKQWRALGKAEQQPRLTTCATKAQQLMKDANPLERFIVKNRAQARVDRLLEKESTR